MAFSAHIQLQGQLLHSVDTDFGGTAASEQFSLIYDLLEGTGSGQAQQEYIATRVLAASANEDLNFNGGSLLDQLGNALALTSVRLLGIWADDANGGAIGVKPSASGGFTGPFAGAAPQQSVACGGALLLINPLSGWTVTPSIASKINIANGDAVNPASYSIWVIGS